MAQAKTLTPAEIDQALAYIDKNRYARRNRVMLLTGLWSGMRVGEIASLKVGDVINANGTNSGPVPTSASFRPIHHNELDSVEQLAGMVSESQTGGGSGSSMTRAVFRAP